MYASSASGDIYVININRSGFETVVKEDTNEINGMDFSSDGRLLATGGKDCHVRIYNAETLDMLDIFSGYPAWDYECVGGHAMRIFAVRFLVSNPNICVTAGWDDAVKVWDVRQRKGPSSTIIGPHICCNDGMDLSLDGHSMLTASWRVADALELWDLRTMKRVKVVPIGGLSSSALPVMFDEHLYCCKFGEHGTMFVAGSGTNSMRAVYEPTDEIIGTIEMPYPVFALDSVLGGRKVAVGDSEGTVKLANVR